MKTFKIILTIALLYLAYSWNTSIPAFFGVELTQEMASRQLLDAPVSTTGWQAWSQLHAFMPYALIAAAFLVWWADVREFVSQGEISADRGAVQSVPEK